MIYIILKYFNDVFSGYRNVYSILYYFIISIISVFSFEIFSYLDFYNMDINPEPKGKFFTETNYLASNPDNPENFNTNDDENMELDEDYFKSLDSNNNNVKDTSMEDTNVEDTNVKDTEKPPFNFIEDSFYPESEDSDMWPEVNNKTHDQERLEKKFVRRHETIEYCEDNIEALRSPEIKDIVKKLDEGKELNDDEQGLLNRTIDKYTKLDISGLDKENLHLYDFRSELEKEISNYEINIRYQQEKLNEYGKRLDEWEARSRSASATAEESAARIKDLESPIPKFPSDSVGEAATGSKMDNSRSH